jgi:uncharacterized protein (UPF0147 family)
MSSQSEQPDSSPPSSANYPPVEPPAATFLLQLFLIPLLIVIIIIAVWLLFSWLANMGNNPDDLVRDLQRLDQGSWRKAYALTNQLRDPEHDALKDDRALCRDLATALTVENQSSNVSRERTKLRIFLCRALGEFRVADGLEPLVEAARKERNDDDVNVRRAALEALAVLANSLGTQAIHDDQNAMNVILAASREVAEGDREARRAMLRSTASFTLGVVGGPAAATRLVQMLDDSFPNARYNAAIGLARHGRIEAVPILLEMLDPRNLQSLKGEKTESAREFKRSLVLANGIRAAAELCKTTDNVDSPDLGKLRAAVSALANDETVPRRIRLDARAAISKWPAGKAAVEM